MASVAAAASVVATCALLWSTDLKRVVAYASVAHMNLALLALAAGTAGAKRGFWIMMLAHGMLSAGLSNVLLRWLLLHWEASLVVLRHWETLESCSMCGLQSLGCYFWSLIWKFTLRWPGHSMQPQVAGSCWLLIGCVGRVCLVKAKVPGSLAWLCSRNAVQSTALLRRVR